MICAMNVEQMSKALCGKSITVNGPLGSVTVTIVDTCMGCASGSVDLSPAAFNKIADQAQGRVPISWSYND